MIVRLKDINIHITVFASFMFQFYDSPIKRHMFSPGAYIFARFNSMIVRLKDVVSEFALGKDVLFQFYDSPIKS